MPVLLGLWCGCADEVTRFRCVGILWRLKKALNLCVCYVFLCCDSVLVSAHVGRSVTHALSAGCALLLRCVRVCVFVNVCAYMRICVSTNS